MSEKIIPFRRKFRRDESASVLIETLIAVPALTVATLGVFEFGHMMWQREQLQVGVRDAARYWSHCRLWNDGTNTCNKAIAENIAFYGDPRGSASGSLRVPGWDDASELTISPLNPPLLPTPSDLITVSGSFVYEGSPALKLLSIPGPTIGYTYETRYVGW